MTARRRRRSPIRLALAGLVAAAAVITGADAGCIHTERLYSCTNHNGEHLVLTCIGPGIVQTCTDISGKWYLVGRHAVISQDTTFDGQLAASLDAASAQPVSTSAADQRKALRALQQLTHDAVETPLMLNGLRAELHDTPNRPQPDRGVSVRDLQNQEAAGAAVPNQSIDLRSLQQQSRDIANDAAPMPSPH